MKKQFFRKMLLFRRMRIIPMLLSLLAITFLFPILLTVFNVNIWPSNKSFSDYSDHQQQEEEQKSHKPYQSQKMIKQQSEQSSRLSLATFFESRQKPEELFKLKNRNNNDEDSLLMMMTVAGNNSNQNLIASNHHRISSSSLKQMTKNSLTNNNLDHNNNDENDDDQSQSLESQLASKFSDLDNRVKYAEMLANHRRQEIYQMLQDVRHLWSMIQQKNQIKKISNYKNNNLINGDNNKSEKNSSFQKHYQNNADHSKRFTNHHSHQRDHENDGYSKLSELTEYVQQSVINQPNYSLSTTSSPRLISSIIHSSLLNVPEASISHSQMIHLPSLLNLIPYLDLTSTTTFDPVVRIASNRTKSPKRARFVFGIPTVKRLVESYLISTLDNLIKNLTPSEQNQSIFVVFIAELDLDYVHETAKQIVNHFKKEIDSELIEIISPPKSFYPDFSKLKQTLGDKPERVRWRSKQNFDFAYLMMYCQTKGTYYIQLEDDIISKPSYLAKIENFITKNALSKNDWLILDFCSLGFIGKLFKTVDLSQFVLFFIMFYNDKPVDWLLLNFVQTKMCRFDEDSKSCKKRIDSIWMTSKPSLFQHIGTHSSLKGKIQKLRDKGFGKMKLYEPHYDNPLAKVYTTMNHYQKYKLSDAYEGRNFFWAINPIKGQLFGFKFDNAVNLERCLIRTGSIEHPEDILFNASIQVKSSIKEKKLLEKISNHLFTSITDDDFIILDHFDSVRGYADVLIPAILNPIQELRVINEVNSTRWVIVNEIHLKKLSGSTTESVSSTNTEKPDSLVA